METEGLIRPLQSSRHHQHSQLGAMGVGEPNTKKPDAVAGLSMSIRYTRRNDRMEIISLTLSQMSIGNHAAF